MTTTITVSTNEGAVEAQRINPMTGQNIIGPERIPPHEIRSFTLHQRQGLLLVEVPASAPELEAAA